MIVISQYEGEVDLKPWIESIWRGGESKSWDHDCPYKKVRWFLMSFLKVDSTKSIGRFDHDSSFNRFDPVTLPRRRRRRRRRRHKEPRTILACVLDCHMASAKPQNRFSWFSPLLLLGGGRRELLRRRRRSSKTPNPVLGHHILLTT